MEREIKCWHCGKPLEPFDFGKVPFKEVCPHCDSWLHCCKNCVYYKPGMPNDCQVPGTDPVTDREKFNYCEEYKLLGQAPKKGPSIDDVSKRLFGE
ncbi:MAG: hypothetical protein H7A37_03795 [Chlamydiales bacterium]|nr:hypothetical protein [Chlamydiia bacterium]MCP5507409.1 hypothetical protein [Chlamydiales bacterium]